MSKNIGQGSGLNWQATSSRIDAHRDELKGLLTPTASGGSGSSPPPQQAQRSQSQLSQQQQQQQQQQQARARVAPTPSPPHGMSANPPEVIAQMRAGQQAAGVSGAAGARPSPQTSQQNHTAAVAAAATRASAVQAIPRTKQNRDELAALLESPPASYVQAPSRPAVPPQRSSAHLPTSGPAQFPGGARAAPQAQSQPVRTLDSNVDELKALLGPSVPSAGAALPALPMQPQRQMAPQHAQQYRMNVPTQALINARSPGMAGVAPAAAARPNVANAASIEQMHVTMFCKFATYIMKRDLRSRDPTEAAQLEAEFMTELKRWHKEWTEQRLTQKQLSERIFELVRVIQPNHQLQSFQEKFRNWRREVMSQNQGAAAAGTNSGGQGVQPGPGQQKPGVSLPASRPADHSLGAPLSNPRQERAVQTQRYALEGGVRPSSVPARPGTQVEPAAVAQGECHSPPQMRAQSAQDGADDEPPPRKKVQANVNGDAMLNNTNAAKASTGKKTLAGKKATKSVVGKTITPKEEPDAVGALKGEHIDADQGTDVGGKRPGYAAELQQQQPAPKRGKPGDTGTNKGGGKPQGSSSGASGAAKSSAEDDGDEIHADSPIEKNAISPGLAGELDGSVPGQPHLPSGTSGMVKTHSGGASAAPVAQKKAERKVRTEDEELDVMYAAGINVENEDDDLSLDEDEHTQGELEPEDFDKFVNPGSVEKIMELVMRRTRVGRRTRVVRQVRRECVEILSLAVRERLQSLLKRLNQISNARQEVSRKLWGAKATTYAVEDVRGELDKLRKEEVRQLDVLIEGRKRRQQDMDAAENGGAITEDRTPIPDDNAKRAENKVVIEKKRQDESLKQTNATLTNILGGLKKRRKSAPSAGAPPSLAAGGTSPVGAGSVASAVGTVGGYGIDGKPPRLSLDAGFTGAISDDSATASVLSKISDGEASVGSRHAAQPPKLPVHVAMPAGLGDLLPLRQAQPQLQMQRDPISIRDCIFLMERDRHMNKSARLMRMMCNLERRPAP
ncbi:hypothetical protein FVE85_0176 [Porphyridium purpureum]|uniref:Transcription initiation factor TFIID component TAF4 C-terminal domain-containing protein n=1 Tax=Porphyridium purpureum TaxID=35688 RepID=A0A5J4Z192_PORPP|nr:hypothetical protein FVE85_0176 [Porphyridium purpureum]|eukprot:POR7446..scf208_2